jgi:protease I
MSIEKLKGKKIAILATDGFEQSELTEPKRLLEKAGAEVSVIAPNNTQKPGEIRGWNMKEWGESVKVDVSLDSAKAEAYDGLVLPGGQINPDKLRLEPKAIAFIKAFGAADKPIAAICHGPWTLIDAGLVKGKKVTSWPSLKVDLTNAGAHWQDAQVVLDGHIITSRKPDDIPAFVNALIEQLAASSRPEREAA